MWEYPTRTARATGAGRSRVRRFAQLQRLDRPRAGRARRRRRSRGGGNPGRRAGVAAEGRQRAEASGREAEERCARNDREPHQGASSLGLLSIGRQWRAPYHRQAGGAAVIAEASSPFRALDRGPRRGTRHGESVKIVHENESIYISIGGCIGWKTPARSCWN